MKILFKLLSGNRVASNNNTVLVKYIVDEDSLNTANNCILNKHAILDEVFKHKVLFIVLPANKEKTKFHIFKALVVRRNDGSICV